MNSQNLNSTAIIHVLCDFSVESPDYTVTQARLARNFPNHKAVISPQPFKKGHILGQSVFLQLVVPEFPEGSIHICRVGTMSRMAPRFVLAKWNGSFFLAPDNGLLPLYFNNDDIVYYNINPSGYQVTDAMSQIYIPALQRLMDSNFEVDGVFEIKEMMVRSAPPTPTLSNNVMNLTVLYNDYYGNAYLNINRRTFEEVGQGRAFRLRISHSMEIKQLSNGYNDVMEGMELCLFGYGDIMQVAVNAGSAVQYLSLIEGRNILLEFAP